MTQPLKDRLPRSEPSDATVERVWQRVSEKSERRLWPFALAFAAAAAAVVIAMLRPGPCDSALCTQSGELMQAALSGDAIDATRVVSLEDRSRVELVPRTVARVGLNTAHAIELELSTGKILVHVEPKGPRRWGINAGDVRVEVVGTTFSVERGKDGVSVEVSEGIVQVSGPNVPGGVTRVAAGQLFTNVVRQETATEEEKREEEKREPESKRKPAAPSPSPSLRSVVPSPASGEREDWRVPAREGRFADAAKIIGADAEKNATPDELILLADVVASEGNVGESERLLAKVATLDAPADVRAIAEYKRGQRLLTLGQPARAVEAFERAIGFGLPPALRTQAEQLVLEAKRRK